MDPLLAFLGRSGCSNPGRIVYLGADAGVHAPALQALGAEHVVLVAGDPDAAARLRRRGELPPGTEVVEAVVAPRAAEVTWRRYSVPMLNGPVDAAAWLAIYPRLRQEDEFTRHAVGIDELLRGVQPLRSDRAGELARPAVLLLDLPGQDGDLLAAADHDTLRRFDWVLVRSRALEGDRPEEHGEPLSAAGFRPVARDAGADPLLPMRAWRFDAAAFRLAELERRVLEQDERLQQLHAALERADQQGQHKLAELVSTRDELRHLQADLGQARERLEVESAAHAAARRALTELQDRFEHSERARLESVATLEALKAEMEVTQQEQAAANARLAARESELQGLNASRDSELASARNDVLQLKGELAQARQQLDTESLAHEAARQALTEVHQRLERSELAWRESAAARDDASATLQATERERAAMSERLAALESEHRGLVALHTTQQQEAERQQARGETLARDLQEALERTAAIEAEASRLKEEWALQRSTLEAEAGAQQASLQAALQAAQDEIADTRSRLQQSQAEAAAQKSRGDALANAKQTGLARIETLTSERQQLQDALNALQQQSEQASAEARSALQAVQDELVQAHAALERTQAEATAQKSRGDALARAKQAALEAQAQLAAELEKLRADAAQALGTERQQHQQTLKREQTQWQAERSTLAAARDEQSKAARESRQRTTAVEAQLAEMSARHALLQEELVKAEAQIELIADLLLREGRA
jgi:chromosome segregation ATPase